MKKFYVLGFLFSEDKKQVVLIRKNKPDWQKGKLNGVGGKMENYDDTPLLAMIREFKEETDYEYKDWIEIAKLNHSDWEIFVFKGIDNLESVKTNTDEIIEIINVADLSSQKKISNLDWLVNMALDSDEFHSIINYK